MPLKYSYKSKDQIPSEHVSLYVEREGVFILDAEGVADARKLAEFRDNNRAILALLGVENVEDAKKKLEKLKDVDPERYAELKKTFEEFEQKKLETKGQYEAALAKQKETMDAAHKKIVEEKDSTISKLTQRLEIVLIDDAVSSAAIKKGVRDTAIMDVKSRARGVFKLEGAESIKAYQGTEPRFGKGGEPLTIDEWVETLLTDAPHLFDPSKGTGAGGGEKGGGFTGKNPYTKGSINLTEQARLEREQPALAKQLQAKAAGAANAP
jgi:hypothetical protein